MTIVTEPATSDFVLMFARSMGIAQTEVFVRVTVFVSSMRTPRPVWSIQTARPDDVMMECVHRVDGVMRIHNALRGSSAPSKVSVFQVAHSISIVELMRFVMVDVVWWVETVREMQNVGKAELVQMALVRSPVVLTKNVAVTQPVSAVNVAPDVMRPRVETTLFVGAAFV